MVLDLSVKIVYTACTMKSDTHPTYYPEAKVKCACGNEFIVGSTREDIRVEICSACHPFYTGQDKVKDTGGRQEESFREVKTFQITPHARGSWPACFRVLLLH